MSGSPAAARIEGLSLYRGARFGLGERTAVLTLALEQELTHWPAGDAHLRAAAMGLRPADPLWGVAPDGWPTAFVRRPAQVTNPAHWVVALSVAFQRWARDPVCSGQVLSCAGNRLSVALPWVREPVLRGAVQFALRHLLLWQQPAQPAGQAEALTAALETWLAAAQGGGLSPNSLRFAQAAQQRDIPVQVERGFIRLGWGCQAVRLDSSFTGSTSHLATRTAKNKFQASCLLADAGLPVPAAALVGTPEAALQSAGRLGWPVVLKPANQDQGAGVTPGIGDEAALRQAFAAAAGLGGGVLVEKHIPGDDHRMLVVGGRLLMTTRRIPGGVTGDGERTVAQLVEAANADPRRGADKRSQLIRLALDPQALGCLAEHGLAPGSVPQTGCFVPLRRTANISTGGTAVDVTGQVHPDNRALAERAARIVGLDIAGVDFLCPDISRSWREVGGAICEVNAQPGFRPHWLGDPARDINGEIVDWLFRDKPARIPTAAITGTNGKSTVARMLHRIWMSAGTTAGVCTTQGVWVGNDAVSARNLSGLPGGQMLLGDPAVEAAVIEMPRKGLLVFGHPCDRYDVAALLNVQDDHIGVDGIASREAMARLKAEVLERASEAIVVDAEDPLCLAMRTHSGARRHILVARDAQAPALARHLATGGDGVFVQLRDGVAWIVLATGSASTPLMPLAEIPATMGGLLACNETNALFAAALAWAQGVIPETIRAGLGGFANDPQQNPGRYNFIEGFPFQVLLDYGHNPDGVRALCQVAAMIEVSGQRRLLNLKIGNRHRAHLTELAPTLARTFDRFVLGCDADYVRRSGDYQGDGPEEMMLAASRDCLLAQGVAEACMVFERDQQQAIRAALASAQAGDLLVLLADPWIAMPILEVARQT